MSLAPQQRIEVVPIGKPLARSYAVNGWTGIQFERLAEFHARLDPADASEKAHETARILNRVLECQERDLLDAPGEGA